MRYKNAVFGKLDDFFCYFMKLGSIGNHLVGDAGNINKIRAYITFGIDEGAELFYDLQAIVYQNTDLGNAALAVFEFP